MGLMDILSRVGKKSMFEPDDDIPDDVTRDRVLRSLRRERRTQMERVEKKSLRDKIATFKRNESKAMFEPMQKDKLTKASFKKVVGNRIGGRGSFLKKGNL